MKLLHLSDLHLGKRLAEFSMLEDQQYILKEILTIADREKPDAVLLAGDLYDRTVPPAEAVTVLSEFLEALARRGLAVLLISGNHDSAERLAFAAPLLARSRVYIAPVYDGTVKKVTLEDEFGPVDFFLLPFLRPAHVRAAFPDEEIDSYTDALRCVIGHMPLDPDRRSVLVTHQFVAGAARCESEELSVGGSDAVDVGVFAPFDYVALGHLHGPQSLDGGRVRYCGTPLKYSFSEARHAKSVTVVTLGPKGQRDVVTADLKPLRDMIEVRGTYDQVTARRFYEALDREAYCRVTLTDEQDIPDAAGKLRTVYPNLMALRYDNARTRGGGEAAEPEAESADPMDLFAGFYRQQNGQDLSEVQRDYLAGQIRRIWEEETP